MFFNARIRRLADGLCMATGALGTPILVLLGATHPAAAAAAVAAAQTAVTCAVTGVSSCVSATNTSSGVGVLGASNTGTGVRGKSNTNYGVKGTSNTGLGVSGDSATGPAGVEGSSPFAGISGTGTGNTIGIFGTTATGGYGILATGPTGTVAPAGIGLDAISTTGYAVVASARTGTGIDAFSESGAGVIASSAATDGLRSAVFSFGGVGLKGTAPANGFPLRLIDIGGHVVFAVDGAGNVQAAGALTGAARVGSGATATAFTPQTTLPTVEDSGTAQLAGGAAVVRLDPSYAAAIDAKAGYRVFLTPNGDTRGLFVETATPGGFIVRESQGGRSTVSFDYRILATALGQTGRRMTVTSLPARVSLPAIPRQ
jgi:hypothetical protein